MIHPSMNNIFKHKLILGKVLLLVVMLLMVMSGLTVLGCAGVRNIPEGGSGGVVADDTLFLCPILKADGGFGCAAPATEGKLIAVNASDGNRLWEVLLEASRPAGGFGCAGPASTPVALYGTPAVAGDLVYVGSYEGKIYAISSSTRLSKEKYLDETNPQPIIGGPVVFQGMVYIGCSDGGVYALNAISLDKVWDFPTGGKIWSTPAIDGNTLYIGSFDKKLYALDTTTGKEKWTKPFETEGAIAATAVIHNNTVYIGSFDRHFYAIDATNGEQVWQFPVEDEAENKPESWFWARPVVCNNTIYVGCLDGKVYILNAESGEELVDPIDLGSPIASSPVLADDKVIIATEDGHIYSLDTDSNQITHMATVEAKVYAPLCASGGVVYVHAEDQTVHALNAQTGVSLWNIPLSK